MRTTNSSTLSLLSLLSLSAVLTGAAAGCDAVEEDLGEVTLRPWGCTGARSLAGTRRRSTTRACPTGTSTVPSATGTRSGWGRRATRWLFKLDVDPLTDRFIGRALSYGPTPGPIILSGSQMLGATFDVVAGDTASVTLEITEYDDTVLSWSDSGGQITAYKATYFDTQGVQRALCPSTDPDNQWFTLIAGERYSGVNEVVARRVRSRSRASARRWPR
jgi:hypothetical protein